MRKYFNYLATETKELLKKEPEPMDKSNDYLNICGEEGIELCEMVDCVLCDERFTSILNLNEHLITKHQMDREKLTAYLKWYSNEICKTKGKN